MSERFCRAAGASHALKGLFGFARQRPIDAKQTDDKRFFGKKSNRFIEQYFCLVQIPCHEGRLWSKVDRIFVGWILSSPRLDLFPCKVEFSVPDIHLDNTVIDRLLGLKRSPGFVNLIWPLSIISFGPTPGLLMIAGLGCSGALLRP